MKETPKYLLTKALALGGLLASAGSFAQIEEVIVTAEFRESNVQETPIAITAVTGDMLEARGQSSIYQVAAQSPNVTLKPQPQNNGIGLVAFIRGIGQTDFNYALEPGVGMYVDDVYIPTLSSSLLDLMDLDRVEILRGPQGTLTGKNSIGGAIKLFSAKPTGDGEGWIKASYGDYRRVGFSGMADFAITDNLFGRISGTTNSMDGYVDVLDYGLTHPGSNVPTNNNAGKGGLLTTLGGRSTSAARLSLRWMPTDRLEVNVSGDYTRERNDSGAEVLLLAVDPSVDDSVNGVTPDGDPWLRGLDGNAIPIDCRFVPYGANSCDTNGGKFISYSNFLDAMEPTTQSPFKPFAAIPGNTFDGWGLMANVQYDLTDDMQLTWISSLREYETSWGMDQDSTPVPNAQLNQSLDHSAWSQEIRLTGTLLDGDLDYTLGAFYFDQDGELQARVDLNYAGIDFIHGPDTTPSTSQAVFLNATYYLTDDWSVTGGYRYSEDEKTYTYFRSNPDGTIPGPGPCEFFLGAPTAGPTGVGNSPNCLLLGLYDISDTFEGSQSDYRLVTNYNFTDSFMAYASLSTGFKGGGVNPRPFFGPASPNNQLANFEPETLTTIEFGFKADLLDDTLRINGAVFQNDYEDVILTLSSCPTSPCLQPNNVGEADVLGFELEALYYPTDNLQFNFGFSTLDFEYTSGTVFDAGLGYDVLVNTVVPASAITPYTPEMSYSLGAQYDQVLANGTVSYRIDGSYQDSIFTEALNTPLSEVDDYFLTNARITYFAESDLQFALEVANLTDEYYMLTKADLSTSLGVVTGQPGMPRTWNLSVKKGF